MANPEHLAIVKSGARAIAKRRAENPSEFLDLTDANLRGLALSDANLKDALLTGANLSNADLSRADFSGATVLHADLTNSLLHGALLEGGSFYGAVFEGAQLSENATLPTTDTLHPVSLCHDMEKTIAAAILRTYPADWVEDAITYEVLQSLRRAFSFANLSQMKKRRTIRWAPYKLRGTAERTFGDIAVLIRFNDSDGVELEGVAFLEAKRRYPKSGAYDELRPTQVNRILQHAPHARVLLYDYEYVNDFTLYQLAVGYYARHRELVPGTGGLSIMIVEEVHPFSGIYATHALAVPVTTVQALASTGRGIARFGVPFAQQLLLRYLNGQDLEFGANELAIAKGWVQGVGAPRYVLVIEVTGSSDGPHWEPGVNRELYSPFERS
jgi:hypothetical protein